MATPCKALSTVLDQTDGMDKLAKVVQYSARLLYALGSSAMIPTTEKRVTSVIKAMSASRKIIRLGKCSFAWPAIGSGRWDPNMSIVTFASQFNDLLGTANDALDDVAFLGNIGFFGDAITRRSDRAAEILWFASCFFDIFLLLIQLQKVRDQLLVITAVRAQALSVPPAPTDEQKKEDDFAEKRGTKLSINLQGSQQITPERPLSPVGALSKQKTAMDKEVAMLRAKRIIVFVGLIKMGGDLGVASSYACKLNTSKREIALFGLASAAAGLYKLWDKARK